MNVSIIMWCIIIVAISVAIGWATTPRKQKLPLRRQEIDSIQRAKNYNEKTRKQ